MPLFGAAYAAPNKGTTIFTDLGIQKTLLNPPVNGKIQGLFKAFECFSSTFQGIFYFQGLFKTVLYIQVLFKPVRTLVKKRLKKWQCTCWSQEVCLQALTAVTGVTVSFFPSQFFPPGKDLTSQFFSPPSQFFPPCYFFGKGLKLIYVSLCS